MAGLSAIGMLVLSPAQTVQAQQEELQQLDEFLTPADPPPAPATPSLRSVVRPSPPQPAPATPPPPPNTSNTNPNPQSQPQPSSSPQAPPPPANRSVATERIERSNVGVRTTSSPRIELGPDLGEGSYLVLMAYQGENSLTLAREYSQEAFIKQYDGKTYVQLASFSQLEYARHLADRLRSQGLSVLILQ